MEKALGLDVRLASGRYVTVADVECLKWGGMTSTCTLEDTDLGLDVLSIYIYVAIDAVILSAHPIYIRISRLMPHKNQSRYCQ